MNLQDEQVQRLILDGNFGLEKESLRVYEDAGFSHSEHPFPDDKNIVKDFCENQTEVNTGVNETAKGAIAELDYHNKRIYAKLQSLEPKEYLWPFSNPPYIKGEDDIPIALYKGAFTSKHEYREYLSGKYGRYKMTFSGIHVNYSFSDALLEADYGSLKRNGYTGDFRDYKDTLYLDIAKKLARYGWVLVALTAASPLMDGSFVEKGAYDRDVFTGMASVRCSELGYWNEFAPVFDYSDLKSYVGSIRHYVERGFLAAPSELYYPIRLKPAGENSLDNLEQNGVNHIELRMYDLNPLSEAGVMLEDVLFAQLLMVYLASLPELEFSERDQLQAVQNFKNSARYDLKTVKTATLEGYDLSMADAGADLVKKMKAFYNDTGVTAGKDGIEVQEVLDFELQKFIEPECRYAWQIRKEYSDGFVQKAMSLAKRRQQR